MRCVLYYQCALRPSVTASSFSSSSPSASSSVDGPGTVVGRRTAVSEVTTLPIQDQWCVDCNYYTHNYLPTSSGEVVTLPPGAISPFYTVDVDTFSKPTSFTSIWGGPIPSSTPSMPSYQAESSDTGGSWNSVVPRCQRRNENYTHTVRPVFQ